jgi:hypothetical protein
MLFRNGSGLSMKSTSMEPILARPTNFAKSAFTKPPKRGSTSLTSRRAAPMPEATPALTWLRAVHGLTTRPSNAALQGCHVQDYIGHLPLRDLRRLYAAHQPTIATAGLGDAWEVFRRSMAEMHKAGHVFTHAEADPEVIGIAIRILDDHSRILGRWRSCSRRTLTSAVVANSR